VGVPDVPAVRRVAGELAVARVGPDVLAVGGARRGRVGDLAARRVGVPLGPGVGQLLLPLLLAVGADAHQYDGATVYRGDEDLVGPHDRGAGPGPGQFQLPGDVLVGAPLGGEVLFGGVAVVLGA